MAILQMTILEMLTLIEWRGHNATCPLCRQTKPRGHKDTCNLHGFIVFFKELTEKAY